VSLKTSVAEKFNLLPASFKVALSVGGKEYSLDQDDDFIDTIEFAGGKDITVLVTNEVTR